MDLLCQDVSNKDLNGGSGMKCYTVSKVLKPYRHAAKK